MTDTTRRDALARSIAARVNDERRTVDELRVVSWVLEGLEIGFDSYGGLYIDTDPRNFVKERAMEARDLLFYTAAQAIAQRDAEAERIEQDFDDVTAERKAFDTSDCNTETGGSSEQH